MSSLQTISPPLYKGGTCEDYRDKFLVYVLLDPNKPGLYNYGNLIFNFEPLYVGSGSSHRPRKSASSRFKHLNFKRLEVFNYILILDIQSDQDLIVDSESYFTDLIGRKVTNSGPLLNIGLGNKELCTGKPKRSDEYRHKIRLSSRDRPVSSETRRKISQSLKGVNVGKTHTPEVCKKLSDSHKGVPWSEARRLAGNKRKKVQDNNIGQVILNYLGE